MKEKAVTSGKLIITKYGNIIYYSKQYVIVKIIIIAENANFSIFNHIKGDATPSGSS